MYSLCLDQALQTTGWAIYKDSTLIDFGHFTIPVSGDIEHRLGLFYNKITELYEKYKFTKIYYEDIQNQSNNLTYKGLAQVQAIVMLWCDFHNIPGEVLAPSHWRSILKDKHKINFGRARADQKKAAKEFVKEFFDKEATEDECDAICLGLAAIQEKKEKKSAF